MAERPTTLRPAHARRHHPYDTPFARRAETQPAAAANPEGARLFLALSAAVCAAGLWAILEQFFH